MPDTKPATDKLVEKIKNRHNRYAVFSEDIDALLALLDERKARMELLEEVRYAAFNLAESFYADGIDARPYVETLKRKLIEYNEVIRHNTPGTPVDGAVHQEEQIHGDHK